MSSRPEVEWDEEQQALMLALAWFEGQQCKGCGHYLPDSTAEEADGQYVLELPTRCHACTAQAIDIEKYRKESPQPEALLFRVVRRGEEG